MVSVSENFKTAMKQPIKEIQAFINYDENAITDSDDLISYKISCDSGLCKTAMRKLEANYLGSHNLLGKWVNVGFGVRLPDGYFDLIDYGSFLVTEMTETKDTETTSIVAYDKMVNAMTLYQKLDIEYPIDLFTYTQKLCEACGLELGNAIFGNQLADFTKGKPNSDHTSYTFENDVLTVSSNATYQYVGFNILNLIKNSNGKTLYFDYESIDFSHGQAPVIQMLITRDSGTSYVPLVKSNGEKRTCVIPEDTSDITNVVLAVECNNTDTAVETSITITKPILQFGTTKLTYQKYNTMNEWQITATKDSDENVIDLWENIEGITYRDIFQQIAQATGSTCIIHDDKVYFKPLTETSENLTYDNMFKLKLEALYGDINSVVLSRTPMVGEDIGKQNEASVQTNGLTEFKIENNEIIDKDRENAITPIFDALSGISYYPFEATTEGLGWYEIGDNITIVNDLGEEFKTSLFNYSITIDGSVKETLKTTAETKTQTQYQYANTVTKQLKNTELIVNKQEQYIKSIVKDMYEEDGILNEKFSKIQQDIENINFSVQNSGGSNLIKNSVMFAYENENEPNNWTVEGDGTLTIVSDVEFQKSGGISCHGFILADKKVRTEQIIRNKETGQIERIERIAVKPFDESNPIYYTFTTKIKKGSDGTCYVKIYNPDFEEDTHIISLQEGETSNFDEHEITALKPMGDQYVIEFYGSADSNVIFTDNMFAMGENKTQWTQANGEVMNTQVNISLDGIVVRADTVLGDYTVISKYEFAGYSNVNGTMTKVFTLNKGVTEVKELLAKDSITMPPLKIVPITEGDMQGWAFVIA